MTDVKQFWQRIPRDVEENLKFRQELHSKLTSDKEAQKTFLEMCYQYPPIAFDCCFFTYNPKKRAGFRNSPFILRLPAQLEAVEECIKAIREGYDILIDKSREEGATELISKIFAFEFLMIPQTSLLVGSRKEEFVDMGTGLGDKRVSGSPKCIFHKILYTFATCPLWMRPNILKTHMHMENLDNGSIIDGEATNPSFGAGDRRTAVMLDEFGRVDAKLAQDIRDSVADVTNCVIYNSTHFYGAGHPYAKLRRSGKIKVIILPWWHNSEKKQGLYKSPDLNQIEFHDNYYFEKYPKAVNRVIHKYSDLERDMFISYPEVKLSLVADGSKKFRSLWYDKEEKRRDPRDVAQNIDMNPIGSGDMFFDPGTLLQLRVKCRPPNYVGDITYNLNQKGQIYNVKFINQGGRKRFKWWGELFYGRPNQSHNYVIACDISAGTGASNSVASVIDCNTREKAGIFVSPNIPPEEFCDQVIAICHWIGGMTHKPYLIWDGYGPGGSFDKRRRFHRYYFCYINTRERLVSKRRTQQPGWYGTKTIKYDALLELRIALSEGLRHDKPVKSLIVYDEDTIGEYEAYAFLDNGDIGLSTSEDISSGARLAHGDRVISDAMAVVAMGEQPKAATKERAKIMPNTAAHRLYLYREGKLDERGITPWLI